MRANRPQSMTRINTRLETFLARQLGLENVDFYEQEACVQDDKKKKLLNKFAFRLLLVCNDRIYLTDNPPKNLNHFICFDDIIDIKTIDDVPKFLSGQEQENALHISIRYYENTKRNLSLMELKKKIIELKRSMLYSKSLDDKVVEIELNTPRSFRSTMLSNGTSSNYLSTLVNKDEFDMTSEYLLTNRSVMSTTRTAKSVRFDNQNHNNISESQQEVSESDITNKKLDTLTDKAVKQRYQTLIERLNQINMGNTRNDSFSLSLPLTPRSLDLTSTSNMSLFSDQTPIVDKKTSKSVESINDKFNLQFIQNTDKKENTLDLYILNPKTTIFQTLKTVHFYSKIRATLNFHSADDTKSEIIDKIKKHSDIEKKLKQMKNEIHANIDDLDLVSQLMDELLCATYSYKIIKKFFWHGSEFYKLIATQIQKYLPKSPANMNSNKSLARRVKELDCCIGFIETLSLMFTETEFYEHRNEYLYDSKCVLLKNLIISLISDPELAVIPENESYNRETYELSKKMENLVYDLSIVAIVLVWDVLHFLRQNSWNNDYFNLESCCKLIETSTYMSSFIARIISELSKIINDKDNIVLSCQNTIIVYKIFNFLWIIIEKSSTSKLKNLLKDKYQEEFNEDQIKLKSFNYYPISSDLVNTVKKLERHVLD